MLKKIMIKISLWPMHCHNKKGHLLIEKCVEFGVPSGPLLGKLKNGNNVTLPSGKLVYSKDVVSEEETCPWFLVVECPSEEYLEAFVNESKFAKFQVPETSPNFTALVVHFTPHHVVQLPAYKEWMRSFSAATTHLVLNEVNSSLCSPAVHQLQHQLHMLHPEIFSCLTETVKHSTDWDDGEFVNVHQANTMEKFSLRPYRGLNRSDALNVKSQEYIDEALEKEGFQEILEQLHMKLKNVLETKADYPELSFLGTGSCIPSKLRNVSAILITTSKDKYILLDCGEGTIGQLHRLYGTKQSLNILKNLTCIFVSHMHADHHLGLIEILELKERVFNENKELHNQKDYCNTPVLIIGPEKLFIWLLNYEKSFRQLSHLYTFTSCPSIKDRSLDPDAEEMCLFKDSDEIYVSTAPVEHSIKAYGLVLQSRHCKWKVVYSGDTMPCQNLITAGADCTILIHEATMEDDLADDAASKKHSTTSQAITVGRRMNADFILLTHFSQRYAKVPIFNDSFSCNVACAFDNMKVKRSQLHLLPLFVPALNCLFAENVEELQLRVAKRHKRI